VLESANQFEERGKIGIYGNDKQLTRIASRQKGYPIG